MAFPSIVPRLSCTVACLLVALLVAPRSTCAAPATAQALEGAWRLVAGEYVDGNGRVTDYARERVEGVKVLGDGHFAFTTTRAGAFWAGGSGTFETDGTHYVEAPRMASYPLVEGGRYRFSYVLEGDTWTLERHEDGKRVEREVWRRVDAAR